MAFLRQAGGIREFDGELAARDLHRTFPGLVNNRSGLSLDAAREAAAEAGYLGADSTRAVSDTDINDLLDAIDNHLVYSVHDLGRVMDRDQRSTLLNIQKSYRAAAGEIRQNLRAAGIDPASAKPEIIYEASVMMTEQRLPWRDALERADADYAADLQDTAREAQSRAAQEASYNSPAFGDAGAGSGASRTAVRSGAERGAYGQAGGERGKAAPPQITAWLAQHASSLPDRTVSARMHASDIAAATGADLPGTLVRPFGGPLDPRSNAPAGIIAYHGPPHDFDCFSSQRIGTGEGNQAYGRGLYFAENEGVARGYRDALSARGADFSVGNQRFMRKDLSPEQQSAYDHIRDVGSIDKAIQESRDEALRTMRPDSTESAYWARREGTLRNWQNGGFRFGTDGTLYQVRLNRDPDQFLDWDKSLAEQSQYVKDRLASPELKPLIDAHQARIADAGGKTFTVANVHTALTDGRNQAVAAQRMRDAGIAGVRYLDRRSRNAGNGSRNYATFNDDDIVVTHKNGQALARPIPLPDMLRGEARSAFGREAQAAGVTAPFSGPLVARAEQLLSGGRHLDYGGVLYKSFLDRAREHGTYTGRVPSDRGELPSQGDAGAGSAGRVLGGGPGRGESGQAGGAPGEPLRANFDAGAAERLAAAKASNADYQQRFKNPLIRSVLADNGFAGQYTMPAGVIPERAFIKGAKGYDRALTFLRAMDGNDSGIAALENAAAEPLRQFMPPTGTLHPNALARWKDNYDGALRALELASPGFRLAVRHCRRRHAGPP